MSKIKNRCIRYSLLLLFLFPLFTILSATDVRTQETVEKWITKVKLKKNAKANGYKITHKSGNNYFVAVKVTDPGTKKLVEGEQKLEYRCKDSDEVKTITLTFSEGNSASIPVSCMDVIRAELIIMY